MSEVKIKKKYKKTNIKPKDFVWTQERLDKLAEMAKTMTLDQIAKYFGICTTGLDKMKVDNKTVNEYYQKGRHGGLEKAVSKLWERIEGGCKSSLFFYLKTQWGFRDSGEENIVNHNITFDFLKKPLKIVNHTGDYTKELESKYEKIMSIGRTQSETEEV